MTSPGYKAGPLVIPFTFQVRLIWALANGRQSTNVLHCIVADGLSASTTLATLVFDQIKADALTDTYLENINTAAALQRIDIRDIRTKSQSIFEAGGAAAPGTGGGNALPDEVALVVTLRTALAGPAHRGRVYLSGFDDSTLTAEGHATPGLTGAAQDWVGRVGGILSANGMALGVGHRGHDAYTNAKGNTVDAELPGTDLVTSVIVRDNVFDSQRRRK